MARVLVIDDCEEFREVVHDLLTDAGYEVSLAEEAEGALKLCEQQSFDIIMCDLVLPTGFEFEESDSAMVGVHTIHALAKKYPSIPIVAVSGQLTGEALRGISQFGAVRCLAKPFGQEELLKVMQEALAHSG